MISQFDILPGAVLWIVAAVALTGSFGCQKSGGRYLALDQAVAETSLKTFLDTWKGGGDLESLKKLEPRIVGNDDSWNAGGKLTDYRIVKSKSDGTNLHVTVELDVVRKKGPGKQQTVYVVGTSPMITIFPQ